jgi:hypothetical protein
MSVAAAPIAWPGRANGFMLPRWTSMTTWSMPTCKAFERISSALPIVLVSFGGGTTATPDRSESTWSSNAPTSRHARQPVLLARCAFAVVAQHGHRNEHHGERLGDHTAAPNHAEWRINWRRVIVCGSRSAVMGLPPRRRG